MSGPRRYLIRMIVFLVAVAALAGVAPPLASSELTISAAAPISASSAFLLRRNRGVKVIFDLSLLFGNPWTCLAGRSTGRRRDRTRLSCTGRFDWQTGRDRHCTRWFPPV